MADRVAVVTVCWFVLWICLGIAVGGVAGMPNTGAITGFFLAIASTLTWPFVLPEPIANWMDDYHHE